MIDECGEQFFLFLVFRGGNCTLYSYITSNTNMNLEGDRQIRHAILGILSCRVCLRHLKHALQSYRMVKVGSEP